MKEPLLIPSKPEEARTSGSPKVLGPVIAPGDSAL